MLELKILPNFLKEKSHDKSTLPTLLKKWIKELSLPERSALLSENFLETIACCFEELSAPSLTDKLFRDTLKNRVKPSIPEGIAKPVSSAHGKIKTLFLCFPKDDKTKKYNFFSLFKELVEKMDTVEKFIVIYHETEFNNDGIIPRIHANNNRICPIHLKDGDLGLIPWMQDLFYPIEYDNKIHLVASQRYRTDEIRALSKILEDNFGTDVRPEDQLLLTKTVLPFEGGNILVGKNFILIGEDSKSLLEVNYEATYQQWFGSNPIFLSSEWELPSKTPLIFDNSKNTLPRFSEKQPLLHLDLFISLAGFNQQGEYILVIGEPVLGEPLYPDPTNKDLNLFFDWFNNVRNAINDIIRQLKQQTSIDFQIIRNPLVLTYEDDCDTSNTRNWMWATYNNCLVEIIENESKQITSKKVWLPSYGSKQADYSEYTMPYKTKQEIAQTMDFPTHTVGFGNWCNLRKYDLQNQSIWSDLGFEVCLLENNYIPLAKDRGSLNCITNCVQRG